MAATNITFIGGYATDVVRILSDKVAIEIIQRLSHFRRVFLIDTEDDCFRETIRLVHEIGEMPAIASVRFRNATIRLEILGLIFLVWNFATVSINIVFARPPTRRVPLSDDTVDSIWREKAVFDSLPQAVLVNRIAEVKIGVAGFIAQRCGCHAELVGGLEVFENFAPVRFFPRAAAMTFIHDDQVEEVRRILFVKSGACSSFCQCLINREINLAALDRIPVLDLRAGVAELSKDFVLRIVDQDVAIGEIENFRAAMFAGSVPRAFQSFQQI